MLATSRMVILLFSKTSSFPQSITASAVLISGSSKQSASSTEVMPLWDLENHGKNLCSVHCLLSKSQFSYFKVPTAFFPFKTKFYADTLIFQICNFLGMQKSQMNNIHLYLISQYPTFAHATALFQAVNDSADSTLSTPIGGSCQQQ